MKDEKLIFWGFTEKSHFFYEKPIYREDCLRKGGGGVRGLDIYRFKEVRGRGQGLGKHSQK